MQNTRETVKSRKVKDNRYESRTNFHPLSVRVHDNRRKEVENYAKTKKCPHYDRVVMLKDEENNILKDRLECSQKENFDLLEDFENMRNRYFFILIIVLIIYVINEICSN